MFVDSYFQACGVFGHVELDNQWKIVLKNYSQDLRLE